MPEGKRQVSGRSYLVAAAMVGVACLAWGGNQAFALRESQGPGGDNVLELHDLGLNGAGQAIGLISAANVRTTHDALGVADFFNLDFTGAGISVVNHDTWMAGIMASRGDQAHPDQLGVAPGAAVYSARVITNDSITFESLAQALETLVVDNNCRVLAVGFQLDETADGNSPWTMIFDYYAYEYNVLLTLVAGNDNTDPNAQITAFGDAYNGLTVGGLVYSQAELYDQVGSRSCIGPTVDGRAKPELVAPAKGILTTNGASDTAWTTVGWYGETSFSSAQAAGLAALLMDLADNSSPQDDDQHLVIKAAMINSAVSQIKTKQGQSSADVYHNHRGFGRLDGLAAHQILSFGQLSPGQSISQGRWAYQGLEPQGADDYSLPLLAGQTIVATVCWDRPVSWQDKPPFNGLIGSNELSADTLADLDMDLYEPGQQISFQSQDHQNNTEKLKFLVTASGTYTLRIENNDSSQTVDYGLAMDLVDRQSITGDFDFDGIVNWNDFSIFASQWLATGQELLTDLNGDQIVDWTDFSIFAANWLQTAWWYGL